MFQLASSNGIKVKLPDGEFQMRIGGLKWLTCWGDNITFLTEHYLLGVLYYERPEEIQWNQWMPISIELNRKKRTKLPIPHPCVVILHCTATSILSTKSSFIFQRYAYIVTESILQINRLLGRGTQACSVDIEGKERETNWRWQ